MRGLILRLAPHLPPPLVRRLGRLQWLGPPAARLSASASEALRMSDVTIAHGVGKGLRFNAAGTFPGYALGTTEPHVQDLLEELLRPGAVFYDVGAGVGFYTVLAARLVGDQGRVIAFEPHPPNRRAIAHNIELNALANVEVVPKALSDRAGTVRLLSPNGPDATCLQVGDVQTFSEPELASALDQRETETVTLDDVVETGAGPPPSFVKIDVEGSEEQVLRGMAQTVERFAPLVLVETHGTEPAVVAALEELSYDVTVLASRKGVWPHVLARRAS